MDVQALLGSRLRQLREAQGLTQDELADLCGTNQGHIGKIERGEINLTLDTLMRIADGLHVSLQYLLDFDQEFVLPYNMGILQSIQYMKSLPEETCNQIAEIIKTFVK